MTRQEGDAGERAEKDSIPDDNNELIPIRTEK
jgi:hypothetical protein